MKLINSRKKLCSKCPYTLGLIQNVANPCPHCKQNGYSSYEWFQKQLAGEKKKSE